MNNKLSDANKKKGLKITVNHQKYKTTQVKNKFSLLFFLPEQITNGWEICSNTRNFCSQENSCVKSVLTC